MDVGRAVDVAVVERLQAWFGPARGEQLKALFRSFSDEADAMIAAMEAGAGRHDRPAVARTAHKLLGSSATIGAQSLAELSAEIEAVSESGGGWVEVLASLSLMAAEQRRFSIEVALLLGSGDEPGSRPRTDD